MNEKRTWLKSGKRTRLRICSAGLSLSLFLTGCGPLSITPVTVPDIAWPESAGQERENADVTVTGFGSLSDEVREQTVPLGTALSKLALPDTLEAYVVVDTEDGAEDDEKPDDGDKDKDKDKDKDPGEGDDNGGETPGEGGDNDGETPGEGDDNDGETPGGGEGGDNGSGTPGEGDGNNGGGTPGEGDNNGGGTPGEGEGSNGGDTPEGGDNNGGDNNNGGQTGDGESGADGEGSPAGENRTESQGTEGGTEPEDSTDAPETSDSADNKITAGLHVQTGSFVMPSYASENPQDGVKAGTLTDTPAADNGGTAPKRPTGTVNETDGTGDTGSTGTTAAPTDGTGSTDTTAAPTDGTGNTGTAAHTAAREERVTLENITWESDPTYDGDTEGVYTFTPVLPEGYVLSEGVSLPQVTVTVEFQGQELTPEQYAHMMAGLQDDPVLLTEEDIFADDPSLAAQAGGPRRAASRAAVQTHPGTYVQTDDNEDNAGTGNPDGDLDKYLFRNAMNHPIEANIVIPEGKLPTKDCYIAVRTYDVNWRAVSGFNRYVEYDKLFINDVRIGTLTGLDYDWNTSYYRVPLSCLREGNNTVRVEIWNLTDRDRFWADDVEEYLNERSCWGVNIDWMQLVCDGGSREGIETFSLTLTDAAKEGGKVAVSAETVIKSTDTSAKYDTEYSIADSKGFIVGSYQEAGVTGGIQKFTVTMPADSRDDTYTVQGLLKRTNDGTVLATDSLKFEYKNGEVLFSPEITHTLSPDTWTNGNVRINPKVADAMGCTGITISPASRTATANGDYEFTVTYKMPSGTQRTKTYTAAVENIDKEPPFIGSSPVTVTEGMTQAAFETLFQESLTVTDNVTKDCTVAYTLPKAADVQAAGGGKVTVTAQDEVGNKATLDCVLLTVSPLSFSTPTAARQGTTKTFTLTAKLTAIGKKAVTETGFVWGIMPNPSLTYNQGSAKTASPVTKANVNFSVKTTEIVEGMTYYARAYAKVGSLCYYSDPVRFDIGAKQCGVFTIEHIRYNSFKVTRTGGTEGAQTVYYRTVNGTAVGGTHFVHKASTLTFKEGETEKTITVSEKGATSTYGGRTATAYSNAARTYEVELYRVTGGGTLGSMTRATRTMSFDLNYEVGRKIYEPLAWSVMSDSTLWDNRGSCHKFEITDGGKGETNGNNNGINWYNGRTNHKGHKSDPFNLPRYHHSMYAGTTKEKAYFLDSKNPSDGWAFRYEMKETQIENGWGHLWVGTAPAPTGKQTVSDKNGASPFNGGSQKWAGFFETGYSAGSTIHVPGTPRDHGNEIWASRENGSIYTYGGQKYIMFGADETAYMHFAANGPKDDVWRIDSITDYQILIDTKEPQLLGVAPMANSAYKPGDEVTISLVFDEIVDSQNSQKAGGLNGLVAKTNWGDFTYSYGADTNVLVFKGTVPANASGRINVNSITHADRIKDLCDHAGGTVSAGTGSTNVTVDTKQPTVAITNTSLTNGTASGRITATNADTLQYAWSQSTAMPAAGWFTCKSGDTVTTRQASGKWYLHALATYEGTGASDYQCSTVFDFGTPESPKFPLPELTAAVDNSNWTNQNRTITITRKPTGAAVKVTKPDGKTETLAANATTYAAQTNGVYTFVLTSNGETVAKDAAVEKIDKVKPTATLTEAGGADAVYHKLTMTAKAADADSGVKSVAYAFTTSPTAPDSASGWTTAADSDKLADGRYRLEYTAAETTQATKYLHVKVTDNAGNTFTASSKGYKVVKEPAVDQKPAITLTASPSGADWTKEDVTLTWKVINGGAGDCTVHVGDEMLTGKKKDDTGTFRAQKNGIYMVSLSDKNGDSASATVLVNNIDKEAPTLEKLTVTPAGYANTKTVTLTGVTDTLTTLYNEKGVTGKGGSGVIKREYQLPGGVWQTLTDDRFFVSKTGTYRVRLTDNAGNVGKEYTINVTSIDTTAPKLTVTVNATPNENSKDKAWYTDSTVPVTLTYTDEAGDEGPASGVAKVEYAFVNPSTPTVNPTTPTSWADNRYSSCLWF